MTEIRATQSLTRLIRPEAIAEFRLIADATQPSSGVLERLRDADEEHELEPALMRIMGEVDATPHGPTEEADIVTVHLHIEGKPVFAAFVLKGKSWRSVKARDVSYQLLRAAQIPTIGLVALAAVGDIQDDAKRDLAFLADRIGLDWLLLDRGDLARLLSAYRELCPKDGTWTHGAACPVCGYGRRPTRRQPPAFQILTLEDVSFAPAKRYAAHILVPPGLDARDVESRVGAAVLKIRSERYSRNELVEAAHGNRDADVVFLFVYENVADRPFANWICRALWISPDLDQRWHPSAFGEPASDPSLRIDWNESYDVVSKLLEDRQDKGSYLKALDAFVRAAEPIVAQARPLLEEAELTPERETKLAALVAPIEDLPRPDRMKAAPHELADLDNLYEGVDADLLNLALPFGPRGQATWPEPARRRWLARQAIEMFDLDLARLSHSREQAR